MIFDLGCCCTVPSGGIYDFWAMGGAGANFIDIYHENSTILSRMPSRQSFIYEYRTLSNISTQRLEGNVNPLKLGNITSFVIGDYMDLWTSGNVLTDTRPATYMYPVSMDIENSERIWINYFTTRDSATSLDFFQHSGIGSTSGQSIGSGARIEGSRLVCTTGVPTSGVYVKWDLPNRASLVNYLDFTMESNFDKTLMISWDSPSGGVFGERLELWFSPTGAMADNFFIEYTGGNPSSSGVLGFTTFEIGGEYQDTSISDNELLHINATSFAEGGIIDNLEFRIVDSVRSYTLDDVSGFSMLLHKIRMPYTIVPEDIPNAEFYSPFTSGNTTLLYVDPVNKEILFRKELSYNEGFYDSLTGIDYYRYGPVSSITGSFNKRKSSFFDFGEDYNISEQSQGFIVNTVIPGESDYTGSVILQRQLQNNIRWQTNQFFNFKPSCMAFSRDGNQVIWFDSFVNIFNNDEEEYVLQPSYFMEEDSSVIAPYDMFTMIQVGATSASHNAGSVNTNRFMSYICANTLDYYQRSQHGSQHQLFITIDATGDTGILYSSPHHFTLAEYNIPQSEKEAYYQKVLDHHNSGIEGYHGNWNAVNIDNFNDGLNLPRIQIIPHKDAPNCFSVKEPRIQFVHNTGLAYNLTGTTGLCNQTVQILYGPITQSTHTSTMLTGQFLGTDYNGNKMRGYNNGLDILGPTPPSQFTGFNGDARPSSSFTYNRITPSGVASSTQGGAYDFEFNLVHGPTGNDAEVFWEDEFEQNVRYYKFHHDQDMGFGASGVGLLFPATTKVTYTGLYRTPCTPNVTATVLYGSKHLPTNTLGASFIHSRNHMLSGTRIAGSGETYIKLKIGDNIVYNERLYYHPDYIDPGFYAPVVGPYALFTTESDQRDTMTGNYAAFVWFEVLYKTNPVPGRTLFANQHASGAGTQTGWKMHVSNITGGDLYAISISGLEEDIFDYTYPAPYVKDSSDAFFYVNNFLLPYTGVTNGDYATQTQSFLDETGGNRNPRYIFVSHTWDISGAIPYFGMSHDGRAVIPAGYEFDEVLVASGQSRTFPNVPQTLWNQEIFSHCVKNTSLMAETPKKDNWLVGTGFPYNTKYYTITGIFMYESPTGLTPIFPLTDAFDRYQQTLVSTTGFNLGDYPGYYYVTSGLNYVKVINGGNTGPFIYFASGTTQSGWFN